MKFKNKSLAMLLCGTTLAGMTPMAALAQDVTDDGADQDTATEIDEEPVIIVTGTQIQGAKIDDVLPVTVVDEALIESIDPGSGDELFRAIPQAGSVAFNDQSTVGGVNGARGDIASINLRGIGTGNTLLLINGRRMVLNPGFQTELLVPVVSPDTNQIVPGSVRRVEVLRDGASAVYGADAVAGVVNTILRGDLDGGVLEGNWRASTGTSLYSASIRGGYGFDFDEGRGNLTLYGYYFHENGAPSSIRDYAASSDRRPFLVGTEFEGDLNFDNRSNDTPWGEFDIQSSRGNTDLNDDDFFVRPCAAFGDENAISDSRFLNLGNGLCADNGTTQTRSQRYNLEGPRDLFSEKDRYSAQGLFRYELSPSIEFYVEGSYYRSESSRFLEQRSNLTAAPLVVLPTAFYNPLGATTLADGSPNPNRLQSGIDGIPDEGVAILIEDYRPVDAGPRFVTVTKDVYRAVAGFRGNFGAWDFDTGFLYTQANTSDFTQNRVSNTLFEQAVNRTDATAYNPFNGACADDPSNGDCTPNPQSVIDSFTIDVFRDGETTLALADFKISRDDLFTLPGGDVGIAAGVEYRRETFEDDRDPRLDGSITYTNSFNGNFFGSDVMGSSPSPDTSGSRNVYSAFAEAFIPLVSPEMDIPLVYELNIQVAGRMEHFSDIDETTIVPRAAASWSLFDGLLFRGAWSQGFRAPNLVQVNDLGTTRSNTRDDLVRCFAEIQKGVIADFDDCSGSGTVSLRTGTNQLQPEDTESINLGVVVSPPFIPGLTLTADYWRVEQEGIVGVFGDQNQIALDLLRRLEGSTNPNVIREDPDQDQIDLFDGTGLAPAGDIIRVNDAYLNLDTRISKGWDFGMFYDVPDFGIGEIDLQVNAAYLESFFQSPGTDGQELLDAVEAGILPGISIANTGEVRELNGRPKWRITGRASWESGPVRVSFFGRYVDSVFDTSVTQDDTGEFFRVDDWFTLNAAISYTIENNTALDGTRLRVGINNIFNEDPPLADQSFGFFSNLHNARGRQVSISLRKEF
ncbi:TonB-dependent receptor domain-containing protein [Erythrobacter sp. THAF29]|uniref:TonB-dependent receptor domain-containing protein n=1 Tax=Erythrobacter sp. THAF29 TaxID=2587851 RepID=UPI00126870FC|nr:TonB-dependent receptor [Erythrobacter sp. THAF29]QFT76832.1 Vitamin B12 transporter BtuB precursor [Erythrobacter sp. THAF29]